MNAFEFGYAVGQLEKSAFFPGAIGGTIGAVQAPSGSRLEGFGRGMVRDWGTQLGAGVGGGQPAAATKQSDNLPTPTSRGDTKKITMPEANKSEPDCDPEGVQMTNKDHDSKEAGIAWPKGFPQAMQVPASVFQALAGSGVFGKNMQNYGQATRLLRRGMSTGKIPNSPAGYKMLRPVGGALADQPQHHSERLVNRLKEILAGGQTKQSFMTGATLGALGGLATSSKGKRHLGMGRGALIGGGTGVAGLTGLNALFGGGGAGGALGYNVGRLLGPKGQLLAAGAGLLGGGAYGGMKGYQGAGKLMGPASYQRPVAPATARGKIEPNMLRLR